MWRLLLPLVGVFLLLAACGGDDDDAMLTLTLDGDQCTYDGPTRFDAPGETFPVVVVNRNEADANFTVYAISDESQFEKFVVEVEGKRATIEEEGGVTGLLTPIITAAVNVGPGESGEMTLRRFPANSNHYALSCANFAGEGPSVARHGPSRITARPAPAGPLEVTWP